MLGPDGRPVIITKGKSRLGLQIFPGIFDAVPADKYLLVIGCNYIYFLQSGKQEPASETMYQVLTGIGPVVCHFHFP